VAADGGARCTIRLPRTYSAPALCPLPTPAPTTPRSRRSCDVATSNRGMQRATWSTRLPLGLGGGGRGTNTPTRVVSAVPRRPGNGHLTSPSRLGVVWARAKRLARRGGVAVFLGRLFNFNRTGSYVLCRSHVLYVCSPVAVAGGQETANRKQEPPARAPVASDARQRPARPARPVQIQQLGHKPGL
jgi:hypothetical protein